MEPDAAGGALLELVRIGDPQRPEFAAWRYGDQFGRRHRNSMITLGGLWTITVGMMLINRFTVTGSAVAMVGTLIQGGFHWNLAAKHWRMQRRTYARIRTDDGEVLTIRGTDTARVMESRFSAAGWALQLHQPDGDALLHGDAAVRAISAIIPRVNFEGGSAKR